MENEKEIIRYTHQEYRKAKIAHVEPRDKEEEYYYKGKQVSKEVADQITKEYMEKKAIKKKSES